MNTAFGPLDDSTRPVAPALEGATAEQDIPGKHLKMIHRLHLGELRRVQRLMAEIEAGERTLPELSEAVAALRMRDNYRRFGNLCGRECQMLTFHHQAEDAMMFPVLMARANEGFRRVVSRLMEEHLVIHEALEALQARADAALAEPGRETATALKAAFTELDRLVRSHFGYEETSLEQALGVYGVEF